jgi:hypothetical protein
MQLAVQLILREAMCRVVRRHAREAGLDEDAAEEHALQRLTELGM